MIEALLRAVRRYASSRGDAQGIVATPIAELTMVSATERGARYALARPLIALVLQGRAHVTMSGRRFELGAGDSLLVAADIPAVVEITRASAGVPFYSLLFQLDLDVVEELASGMSVAVRDRRAAVRVERVESEAGDAAVRLVRLLERPPALPILKAQLVREMHYWLMAGRHGPAIRELADRSLLQAQ